MANFLYRGIAHPFRKGTRSFPEAAVDKDLIKQSIHMIVFTSRGERVMRPDFGSGAQRFVFANNDPFLESLIKEDLRASIAKFEPRVIVQEIRTTREDTSIEIEVFYVIRATGTVDSVSDVVDVPTAQE